ncbi:MAG TPA: SDR family oxidoreductase [Nitrososphaeraceae archaeon]|nr:SDR family oxidoreductase [Nitrososphaeraceae archaeon]
MKQDSPVAVVTGGNRGIGFEICKELSKVGCCVVLTSRDEEHGKKAVAKLGADKKNIVYHKLDVTDSKEIETLRDWILQMYGRVDILINNAGIYLDEGTSVFEVDEKIVRETLDVNFYGAFNICRILVPIMSKNGYGRIVNISSGYGAMSEMAGYHAAYRISKAALNALTLIMADELRNVSIKVNAVCPGWVNTDMGGRMAPVSVEKAAKDIVHVALMDEEGPTGSFFRHKKPIEW